MAVFGNKKRAPKSADARKNASFSGCGGTSDPTNGVQPVKGGVVSGSKNVRPPNAKSYASFSGVGHGTKSKI